MKKILLFAGLLFCLGIFSVSTTSCNRGMGCPAYDNVQSKAGKKGQLSTRKGKSQLFPKSMRGKSKR